MIDPALALLERHVAGRSVAVVAKNPKCRDLEVGESVLVRFNNDDGWADIWATTRPCTGTSLYESCVLVVVPRSPQDGNVLECLSRSTGPLEKPVQYWHAGGHGELTHRLGYYPTTGLAFLTMLAQTTMASCTLYGFDAHATPDPRVDLLLFYRSHAPIQELAVLRDLLASDHRFRAGLHTRLWWPEICWRFRGAVFQAQRLVGYWRRRGLARTLRRILYVLGQRLRRAPVADEVD